MITAQDLISAGVKPGKWIPAAVIAANSHEGTRSDKLAVAHGHVPKTIPLQSPAPYHVNIAPETPDEVANVQSVLASMDALMRVPTVAHGAVMPDACPAGEIPVGGVVAARNAIHPGWHSADICCSMAISVLGKIDRNGIFDHPARVLDIAMGATHFGYGGRRDAIPLAASLKTSIAANPFTAPLMALAVRDFASQGDGNHFFFVGKMKSSGETAIVTHHGSRGFGAALYKAGMRVAEKYRAELSPETPKGSAWIPADSKAGVAYWEALEIIERWTEASHYAIHDLILEGCGVPFTDRFFNPHNFVFFRDDLFYHAKGATPGWLPRTLVPLNMAEPILITRGTGAANGLGFLPHGAGRNMSRTRYLRENTVHEMPAGIDARFYSGKPDHSELPSAYKSAAQVRGAIAHYGLAEIIDEVLPYGNIMAGELEQFWRKK